MESKLLKYVEGERYHNVFNFKKESMVKLIKYMFQFLNNDKNSISEGDLKNIMDSLACMYDTLALKECQTEDKEFINDFILLCYNVGLKSQNTGIQGRVEAVRRITQLQGSMIAQIEISQRQLKYMERYERFCPPALEINKSYLANLQERLK
ncbi:MAG: hypothetical protein PHW62_06710 [Candidatus Ratteibacteria bacterium]|jgi:hypothetical protein|nr:hypothetical protein [Candidatus Ratteibacteria bacterium]